MTEAASAMAGVHAQVPSAAALSLALRVPATTRVDVARALWEERSLVRTFGPRGTVHLLPTADLSWWMVALGSVPPRGGHAPGVSLDPEEMDAVVAALDEALREGDRTRDELDALIGELCGAWAVEETMPAFGGFWPRWRQALDVAASRGVLCFGPNRDRRVTYASARRWLPQLSLPPVVQAQRRLVEAYLYAYGPATPAHLARWLATSTEFATQLFARADLDEVETEGEVAWVPRGDTGFAAAPPPAVRLLPYFDAFVVGSQPRSLLFPGRAAERALAGGQAGNFPVLLLDGMVGGVWHQKRSGSKVTITVEPLERLTTAQKQAVGEQVERVAAILQTRPEMVIGPVSVGPHA